MFGIFLVSSCFSLKANAQKQILTQAFFDLEIVKYSNRPDTALEHYHLLEVTNNSNKTNEFELYIKPINCIDDYENIIKNQKGQLDITDEEYATKNKSSLKYEILNQNLTKKLNKISLSAKETIKLYLKITRLNNTEMGKSKCYKFIAKSVSNNQEKNLKKSVIIKTSISDIILIGH